MILKPFENYLVRKRRSKSIPEGEDTERDPFLPFALFLGRSRRSPDVVLLGHSCIGMVRRYIHALRHLTLRATPLSPTYMCVYWVLEENGARREHHTGALIVIEAATTDGGFEGCSSTPSGRVFK